MADVLNNNDTELPKKTLIRLLTDNPETTDLFKHANTIREKHLGNIVHLRALLEFSNICRNHCFYCGLRCANHTLKRYWLDLENIITLADSAIQEGYKTIVLQSGEDVFYSADKICYLIEQIKKHDVAITLSIGERSYQDYKLFRQAGADRYLMRIETTDKNLYHTLHPHMSWEKRHECLLMLQELGYELGSGILVGLPNQSIESIANDLLYLQKLNIDMAGIGPFIPHTQTPLAHEKGGTYLLALKTMALMRILLPTINIPATTAMEALQPNGRMKALQCGANVIMQNINSAEYRSLYDLYPHKNSKENTSKREELTKKLLQNGYTIGTDWGNHQKTPDSSGHFKK